VENARLFRQADELNRLKDEFLATLSHELRTPLAAVLGWARMLNTGQLDSEKAAQAVQAIERSAQAQSKIVDDILDVARGMAGNLRLDMTRFDLAVLVQGSVEAIASGAAAKRIQVLVRAPTPVEWGFQRRFSRSCSTNSARPMALSPVNMGVLAWAWRLPGIWSSFTEALLKPTAMAKEPAHPSP
jgi:signal transduction histidine kinase